jgi:diaminohydroxyphosphoribosylaminopyrimidine deaminase / 5-amino-6-(5-phosphoribosylamino)uracil reductase
MHEPFMIAALKQAWAGRGMTAPNPAVGAVAVLNGMIIAQAVTAPNQGVGQPHAEQLLLDMLPDDCSHITLYVTLEPCNHWGLTPPCTAGIIQRRVKQVAYAYTDPNPLVSKNNTPDLLRQEGIDVLHYPMPEINAFYASYTHWVQTGRPWVTVKIAQSIDGKIAGKNNQRMQLSNAATSAVTHQARLHTDVILTTARTIQQDNPLLTARVGETVVQKPIAVLDRAQSLDATAHIHDTAQKLHLYHANTASEKQIDLEAVLDDLGRIGYHDVWVEAGGRLFTALHQAQLVQRTIVYIVPDNLGPDATPLYHAAHLLSGAKEVVFEILDDNLKMTLDWS